MDNAIHWIDRYAVDSVVCFVKTYIKYTIHAQRYLSFEQLDTDVLPGFLLSENSLFCMERGDNRFRPMCCHFLSDSPCDDKLLGAEECQSPFGTYEISIAIDKNVPCKSKSSRITDENCKDFDVGE